MLPLAMVLGLSLSPRLVTAQQHEGMQHENHQSMHEGMGECMAANGGCTHMMNSFGHETAGTYLAVDGDGAVILQLTADGTMTVMYSLQFAGGALNDRFSNTLGTWKETGERAIEAATSDIVYDADGTFVGVAMTDYSMKFDQSLNSVHASCTGAIYAPGSNPLDPDTDPVANGEFDCGDAPMNFQRVQIGD